MTKRISMILVIALIVSTIQFAGASGKIYPVGRVDRVYAEDPVEVTTFDGLKAAVEGANEGDVIKVANNIVFTSPVSITTSMSIIAPENTDVSLTAPIGTGRYDYRHFTIEQNEVNITISGLELAGSSNIDQERTQFTGGVEIDGYYSVKLFIDNCTLNDNVSFYDGGAIKFAHAIPEELQGIVTDKSLLTIKNSTLENNKAGHTGGGASSNSATVIENCSITGNKSNLHGGGVYSTDRIEVNNSFISDNETSANASDGGGVYAGDVEVENSMFSGNECSRFGGGLYGITVSVVNCTFAENKTADTGGGLYGFDMKAVNCTIMKNESRNSAYGLAAHRTADLRGCIVSGNTNTMIDEDESNLKQVQTNFIGTTYTWPESTPEDSIIEGTHADGKNNVIREPEGYSLTDMFGSEDPVPGDYGGSTESFRPKIKMLAVPVNNETRGWLPETDQRGFARYLKEYATLGSYELNISVDNYEDMKAAVGHAVSGSTVGISATGTMEFDDHINVTTSMSIEGPGMDELTLIAAAERRHLRTYNSSAILNVSGLTFKGPENIFASTVNGGVAAGGSLTPGKALNISECRFEENHNNAGTGGGGAVSASAELNIENSVIYNNSSKNPGGGVSNDGNSNIDSCLFEGNVGAGGGGISAGTATLTTKISNSTFMNNSGTTSTHGKSLQTLGHAEITNCTFDRTGTSTSYGTEIAVSNSGRSLTIRGSVINSNDPENAVRQNGIATSGTTNSWPICSPAETFSEGTSGSTYAYGEYNVIGEPAGFGPSDIFAGGTPILADNGGLTDTVKTTEKIRLIPTVGTNWLPQTDQRGKSRIDRPYACIGAYELDYIGSFAQKTSNSMALSAVNTGIGKLFTITAKGDRQGVKNADSVAGDTKFVPGTFTISGNAGGGSFADKGGNSQATAKIGKEGSFTVTVTFEEEKWDGQKWTGTGITDKKAATIKINSNVTKVYTPVKTIYVKKGKSLTLPVLANTSDSVTPILTWKSSKPGTVKLLNQSGQIKALKTGTAKITATAGNGKSETVTVKVVSKTTKVKRITIRGTPKSMKKGTSRYLTVSVSPKKATGAVAKFKSSKKSVVSVSKAGKLTAKKKGTAKITVTVGGKKKVITVRVK